MKRDPESLIGRHLGGRFQLESLVGQYPYGVVFDARDLKTDKPVAVRLLLSVPPPGPQFETEARRLRALHGELVAQLYAAVRLTDGTAGLVMAPIVGETLLDRLKRGSFSIQEALHILDHLLQALAVCHAAGVVHRDVRPENILLTYGADPARPALKLHGAGLVHLLAQSATSNLGGVLYGHPLFTAPEQWVNRGVDARTDLYAVALLGFVILLGKHFIRPGQPLNVCRQHFRALRPALTHTSRGETIPVALASALSRAAHAEPRERFATVDLFRAELAAARVEVPDRPPLPRLPTGEFPALDAGTSKLDLTALEAITNELADAFDD
ncbi:MAG: protein kinase [Myxococcales bacterium]|nr:protein kinase [Myxococcales bacterium]